MHGGDLVKREELLAEARKHLWAAWAVSAEEIGSQAAETLANLGMLVPEGGAQELERLQKRIEALESLVAAATEYRVWKPGGVGLYVRRSVAATGFGVWEARTRREGRRAWTRDGWQWLALLSDAEVFCWPDAATAVAEARRLVGEGSSVEESADKLTRLLAPTQALREDPHDSPLHRSFRLGHDMPQTGGAS